MSWESFGVVGFDLGPLLQGQTRIAKLKSVYNSLIIDPRGLQFKPTHTKSWARNLLMLDLTFGPSFKVKRWFTGFGELSFRWIQICIGSLMRSSSFSFMGRFIFAMQKQSLCFASDPLVGFTKFKFLIIVSFVEKRQHGLMEKMAKMEICEESTYSRPQCCSNKSCEGKSNCRSHVTSPTLTSPVSPCDTHQNCYSMCGTSLNPVSRRGSGHAGNSPYIEHGSANYEMKGSASEMSFRGPVPPHYSVYNSPVRSNRRFCDDQTSLATGGYPSPRFCRSESEPTYFDRTYGGRHSFHGVPPPRRHSEVVTFVHHVTQPSNVVSSYSRTVCSKCQRQSACDNPLAVPPCGGGYMNYGPSPCCRHRGVVTNVIAEECSPCLSNSSSIEDVTLSPRSLSVKANVHRADHQHVDDSFNNNSCHQRQSSELSQGTIPEENKVADHQHHAQTWSSGSSCGQSSQQSVSTESEPPIEQYKPKGHVSPTQRMKNREMWDENDNTERNDARTTDLQENYAQTSDLVINTTIVQSVQQLCSKLGLQVCVT